jgi:hypothetical protein
MTEERLTEDVALAFRQAVAFRAALEVTVERLGQYTGMCACPGVSCVESCGECDKTQALVNGVRALLDGRS